MWMILLLASLGCYLLKLSGIIASKRLLEHPRIRHVVELLPVALLAALITVQILADGRTLSIDARLAGIIVAAVTVRLRAPFLIVIFSASVSTAILRMIEKA